MQITIAGSLEGYRNRVALVSYFLHDWLAYVTSTKYILVDFDTSFTKIALEQIGDGQSGLLRSLEGSFLTEETNKSLVSRYYVFNEILRSGVSSKIIQPWVYLTFLSICTKNVRFFDLDSVHLWRNIRESDNLKQALLDYKNLIIKKTKDYGNLLDDTDFITIRNHAILSSHCLYYGLCLVLIILASESKIEASPTTEHIYKAISNTLTKLEGVFFNVKNR